MSIRAVPRRLWHLPVALLLALAFLAPGALGEEEPTGKAPPKDEPPKPRSVPGGPPKASPTIPNGPGERESWRERMWRAPTDKDWAKPCLLQWQRSWDDAVAVSKETGKPIMICINMDGEIASEHWAGIRYREPETAALYKPYVTVIASVYRHTPRDHDDQGRRIPCPRFGGVTCGEHIAIEPVIYRMYCEGQRIAPRHIAVDLDGNESYDIFYANDTQSIRDAIKDGASRFPPPKPEIARGDRPILERVGSRHVADREAVEQAYRDGDPAARKALLEAATSHADKAPLELVRLGIFGLDVDLARIARAALAKTATPSATDLINEAMQVPMDDGERRLLIDALKRLGESSTLARWLAGVHEGLGGTESGIDAEAWRRANPDGTRRATVRDRDPDVLTSQSEYQARVAEDRPDDPAARMALAESHLAIALAAPKTYAGNQRMARQVARHVHRDAVREAEAARGLGAPVWRVELVRTLSAYYQGERDAAYAHAAKAMPGLPPTASDWNSMALLTIFAESRFRAIKAAVRNKEDWPPKALADLHAAYAALQRHPLGTPDQVVWHHEFLVWLGAEHKAGQVLLGGIERFPDAVALHQRVRDRLLRRLGPAGLEAAYARMLEKAKDPGRLQGFAAYASVVAAEQHRRRGRSDEAIAAYERAIARYEKGVEAFPTTKDAGDHGVAMALAGIARAAYRAGDDERAVVSIIASFQRRPRSAGERDAMGFTPAETAQMLLSRLRRREAHEAALLVEAALAALDEDLKRPDRGLLGDR